MGPSPIWIPILALTIGPLMIVMLPMARAYARRMSADQSRAAIPPEVAARLERIEQAVEAVAIEVERISEGQRFTTKLLSEGKGDRTAIAQQ